jgi:hypothetical protein
MPLARRLRWPDRQEMLTAGTSVEEGLKFGFKHSNPCLTITLNGNPVGIFGVIPTSVEGLGAVWLVGTPKMVAPKNRFRFLRESKKWLAELNGRYRILGNYIDSRNTVHVAWVKWLGFEIKEETMIDGVPFYRFSKEID